MSPEMVVDLQIEAFNRGDPDGLAATYATDAIITSPMSGDPPFQGRSAICEHYAGMFSAIPDLHASVVGRLVAGNLVTDHEHLPAVSARAIVTYEVEAGLIRRAWLFGPFPS